MTLSRREFDEMILQAEHDAGLADLLAKAEEYYLLTRQIKAQQPPVFVEYRALLRNRELIKY